MGKRRTRREKEAAKHQFLLSWKPEAKSDISEPVVKRETESNLKAQISNVKTLNKVDISVKTENIALQKRDTVKSLILASLILGAELVIYFIPNIL